MTLVTEVRQADTQVRQADDVLILLEKASRGGAVERVLLETLTYRARYEKGEAILASFRTPAWRRRLYESLAHLEQSGYVSRSAEGYKLTESGRSHLGEIPPGEDHRRLIGELVKRYLEKSVATEAPSSSISSSV